MMRSRHLRVGAVGIVALLACAPRAQAQAKTAAPPDTRETNLRAYVELLRSDLRAQKVAVITEVMGFTEKEDAAFWPVYREYEAELAKINEQRMTLIKEYAQVSDTLTDATADSIALRALALESKRQALLDRFYGRFKAVVPAKTAARFLQVEHQILLLLDLQIASALPIAER